MRAGHTALAKLVEITEKFLNTDTFHHNGGLKSILNIARVIRDDHMVLHEAVIDDIEVLSRLLEEGRYLLRAHSNLFELFGLRALGLVSWEHVLRTVHIFAEVEIVDLLGVTTVAVAAGDEIKHFLARRHNVKSFHDTEELLGSDVLLGTADATDTGAVEVHEAGLEEDAVGDNVPVQLSHHLDHLFFLLICEDLFEFYTMLVWRFRFANSVTYSGGASILNDL